MEYPCVLGAVRFNGLRPMPQNPPIKFTSGMKGMAISLEFDSSWDTLPFRLAVFRCVDYVETVYNVTNYVEVPASILARPFTTVGLSIVGHDVEADAEKYARCAEINSRLKNIEAQIWFADFEKSGELLSESRALRYELKSLNLPTKRFPTMMLPIGYVVPGAQSTGGVDL